VKVQKSIEIVAPQEKVWPLLVESKKSLSGVLPLGNSSTLASSVAAWAQRYRAVIWEIPV